MKMEAKVSPNMETKIQAKLEAKVYPNLETKMYPNLETMCRLCLKENAGTVHIFNKEKNSDKYAALSIPMRIMACAALEVHECDEFPKKICTECRLQLEKSYYFRKVSQAADAKIKKHLRFIGMGKTSKVFNKNLEEDEDEEPEFQDSINFIKEQEEQQKQFEQIRIDSFLNALKLKNEEELKKLRENLKDKCKEELLPTIREEARKELRTEVQNELEENIRKEVTETCIAQAKDSLREECRQVEIKCLLDDLQQYLNNKNRVTDTERKRLLSPENNKVITSAKKCKDSPKMELILHDENVEKQNVLAEITTEDELNTNDEDCGSEGNYLVYDIGESFDAKKKPLEDKFEYEEHVQEAEYDDDYTDTNIISYDKFENIYTNEESGEATSTTSYRIEDNEDGEIQFLKKSDDNINNVIEEISDPTNDNIMVINIANEIENENVEKNIKAEKHVSTTIKRYPGKIKQKSSVTTTTSSTSETVFLTKTYVNPLQRSTDTAKIFKCNDCPMVFSTKTSLERHLRTHRKVEKTGIKFQCPECCIVVSCSSALRRHMYVHCDEKPFTCNVCEKSFVQKEILKRHMQTHTGIKPHKCPHCERSFAQRINLTQHINRTHLEEPRTQQHPCHLCPKSFCHASGLSRHLALHGGVAFQCSECDRTFSDRSSIKRHIMNIHSNTRSVKDAKRGSM